jgi:CBS domain-containing protein
VTADVLDPGPTTTIADVMSRPVLTVERNESLWDAWQLLFVSGMRHLVVLDEDGASVGVLSDRAIFAEVPATAAHLATRQVREILAMVPLISVDPGSTPVDAARAMVHNAVDALPVLDGSRRLVGVVTQGDILKWLVR